ncbi:MAG: hypothetical protein QOC64_2630 [Solirubrobacteraceae bacterium]|jgi:signal transduction histidine kinase|nr:hypothetical protein [Solirubrobacteraceae bacterium]
MDALRLRLTLLYAGVLAAATAVLLALSWWLLHRHLGRTLPAAYADAVASQVAWQYVLAAVGLVMVAAGAGWLFAGPLLQRVEAAVERQRRFVANASHELRTPLTVIRTEAEVTLADPAASVEQLREMGRVIVEATERSEQLLEGLLVLATTSHGTRADEPVELAALAHGVVASLHGPAARARVRFDVDTQPAWVRGDPMLLERLVANLVENAIRHSPGCAARVRVRHGSGAAVVEVANGGAVIAPELAARLSEPFQRLGRHGRERGSGLGLSIVRAVAEAHGGSFELHAPASGGLRTQVTLPAVTAA